MRDKMKDALEKTSLAELEQLIIDVTFNDVKIVEVKEPTALMPQGKVEGVWIDIAYISPEMLPEDLKRMRDLVGYERRTSFAVPGRHYCKSCNKTLESRGNEIRLCECSIDKISNV